MQHTLIGVHAVGCLIYHSHGVVSQSFHWAFSSSAFVLTFSSLPAPTHSQKIRKKRLWIIQMSLTRSTGRMRYLRSFIPPPRKRLVCFSVRSSLYRAFRFSVCSGRRPQSNRDALRSPTKRA